MLLHGWDLGYLDAAQMAPLVTELARYSLADSLPRSRTTAFRSGARSTMDGREGRYPTPLNVAEMAVAMLAPGPDERVFDGSCGTGTFLATAAVHMFKRFLAEAGTTPDTATRDELRAAQMRTAQWAADHVFGCDMNPALVVAARLNVLLTAGHPGNIYRIDARTFPSGELEDQERARAAAPFGSMDIVVTNPWFSTKEKIDDEAILRPYDLGHVWIRNEDGHFVNTGAVKAGGVPPEVLFLERAWHWAKPGTGRIAVLLPDGLLGNPGDEYVRWWILRHCEGAGQSRSAGGAVQGDTEGLHLDTGASEPPGATAPERRGVDACRLSRILGIHGGCRPRWCRCARQPAVRAFSRWCGADFRR